MSLLIDEAPGCELSHCMTLPPSGMIYTPVAKAADPVQIHNWTNFNVSNNSKISWFDGQSMSMQTAVGWL